MRRRQIFASLNQLKESIRENQERQEAAEEVLKNACPKCGKVFARGMHLHTKHCKG